MSNVVVPIHNPDGKFHVWHMREIFKGPDTGRYVPNVDDAVWDWETGLYRVVAVNLTTGLSTLEPYEAPEDHGPNPEDFLIGGNRDHLVEDFRVFIDTSVTPHTMAVDSRRPVYGTTKAYAKLFLGTDIGAGGQVLSAMYDPNGNFLGENIPLELVATPDHHNHAIKVPMVGYTNFRLDDGEVVTCVVYNDDGHATDVYRLIVKNTAFIRTTDASRKYVQGIHLESPFLSPTDHRTLEFPVNMPVESLPVDGVVTYSDGSTTRLPLGGKFQLYGTDNYITTIVGQRLPLALSYRLSTDEYVYGAAPGDHLHITEKYWGTTKEFEKSFSIKLFGFPEWKGDLEGYQMEYFLYNLDRQEVFPVTQHVRLADNSNRFNPLSWGGKQNLTLEVEMDRVSRRYPAFRHIQTIEVTLLRPPSQVGTKWTVGFSPNVPKPYGEDLEATLRMTDVNNWKLNIGSGETAFQPWIEKMFYATEPLFHQELELQAPMPNLIKVVTGNRTYEVNTTDFNQDIAVHESVPVGGNAYVQFIYRTHDNDLQLGVSALPIRRIS